VAATPRPPHTSTIRQGTLAAGDKQLDSHEYYDDYTIQAAAGDEIIAVLTSGDFDPYLMLIPPSGEKLDNDDFGGSADVSLIEVPIDAPGTYTVRVTTYEPGETGAYALMMGTREADGQDAGEMDDFEPEEFTVKGPIQIGTPVSGTLGADDSTRQDGSYYEAFSLQAQAGTNVVITLTSKDFDAYLTLVSPSGAIEENDDQAEGNHDSKITKTLDESGQWIVVANTLTEGETGNYRLTVARR
jgi:serine protease Do